ncbi:MAG: heparinase II/III family protein [Clostridia bacterium]|nr:heparinase II/III family protein [Clostridia bacterium]
MGSLIRIFEESCATTEGKILPLNEFVLCRDAIGHKITEINGRIFAAKAESMLGEAIPLLPLSLYRDKALTGVRSRFEKPHHRRREMLLYLTLAECYEGHGRFTEKIADILWAILEETSWVIPAHYAHSVSDPKRTVPEWCESDDIPGLDLYAANCCATVALTRYLLKDQLDSISPEIARRVDRQIYLRGIHPFLEVSYSWNGERTGKANNWLTNITSNILLATALTEADISIREQVVRKAMRYLDNFTSGYPEDGYCDEGPGYWSGAGGNYFDCLELIEDMSGGRINVYSHPMIRKMGEYIADFNIDGEYYLNFSDAKPRLRPDGRMIMRFGEKCGSKPLYSFGKMLASSMEPEKSALFFGMCYRAYKNSLTEAVSQGEKTAAKRSIWYEGGKIAIFRETADTEKGLYIATKGGCNAEAHNHNDVGCVVVYYDGKPIIVDPSHGSYDNEFFGSKRYARWYMKGSYHSVPTVNGVEQSAGVAFASSDESFDPDKQTVSMELKNAFPTNTGILRMKRTCSLTEGSVSITDDILLERDGDIKFNYLTVDEPRVLSEGILAVAMGKRLEFDPTGIETVIERVENTYLPYEDLNFRAVWGRDCLWRICLCTRATAKKLTVTIK